MAFERLNTDALITNQKKKKKVMKSHPHILCISIDDCVTLHDIYPTIIIEFLDNLFKFLLKMY